MPTTMLVVSGSPNTSVPTRMAVTGSNTPITEALVAPMLRVATAKVAVDTMVGSSASHTRLSQSVAPSIPAVISVSAMMMRARNTAAPTVRA